MEIDRRTLLRTTALGAAALAGCAGGDGGNDPTETATESPTETATPTETAATTETPAAVQVRSHSELGDVLVDAEGMTLYMFDSDTQGSNESTCSGGCADAWPPLTVEETPSAGMDVTAELTSFERSGGATQVAANGWPLYYFAQDESPGDANGQGANDVWWVLRPDGTPVKSSGTATATAASGY